MTRKTSLSGGSGLGAVLFDEPSQMALQAVKQGTEQKKILSYANAKKEISGKEKKRRNRAAFIGVKVVQKWRRRFVRFLLVISSLLTLATLFPSILGASRRNAHGRVEPPQDMKSRILDVERLS